MSKPHNMEYNQLLSNKKSVIRVVLKISSVRYFFLFQKCFHLLQNSSTQGSFDGWDLHQGASALTSTEIKGVASLFFWVTVSVSLQPDTAHAGRCTPRVWSAPFANRKWPGVQLHHTARPEVLGFLFGFKCERNIRFWEILPINSAILIIVSNLLRLDLGGSVYHASNQAELSLFLLFSQAVVQECEIKNANTETSREERVCWKFRC